MHITTIRLSIYKKIYWFLNRDVNYIQTLKTFIIIVVHFGVSKVYKEGNYQYEP